ncbi:hypothetical protein F4777DRAFT_593701 [Nemania sp. FL0916]|nr:hypothetical protein F4777DRAFT_593701 [Nemania sp. FL0916]
MCRYRQTLFQCNHTLRAAAPFQICAQQQAEPQQYCGEALVHPCSTIRANQACDVCAARKNATDGRLSEVKARIQAMRQHLNITYGECLRHVNEAGVGADAGKEVKTEDVKAEKEEDPVQAFLKMKRTEKYAHLTMLGGARP